MPDENRSRSENEVDWTSGEPEGTRLLRRLLAETLDHNLNMRWLAIVGVALAALILWRVW